VTCSLCGKDLGQERAVVAFTCLRTSCAASLSACLRCARGVAGNGVGTPFGDGMVRVALELRHGCPNPALAKGSAC
jgi:hypothetical protein